DNEGVIEEVLLRRNRLSRPDPHHRTVEQVIVANVDAVLVVQSLVRPDLDLLAMDKCLVMALASGIPPAVAVTKTDLADPPSLACYEELFPVFRISAVSGDGLDELQEFLSGKTTVLLGPSGVGKSSVLNSLDPDLGLKVGEVSGRTGSGRHTTTWVEILEVGDARAVDTPGLEFFDFWNLGPKDLPDCFPEFEGYECRFRDCAHDKEPGCGVREDVGIEIARSRHESYLAIRRILQEKGVAFTPPVRRGRPKGRREEDGG
ncbi:MAG: ribosome small subunit-dependent GTPase A, partial [Planctomycetota bacterium]